MVWVLMDRYPDPVPEDLSETDGGPAPEEPSGSRLHPDVTQHLFDVVSPLFRRVDMIFMAVIKVQRTSMHQQSEEWTGHAQTLQLIIMIKKKV